MFGGFTFDGIDIDKLDLEYAPDNANTYVHKATASTISEQKFEGHDGGYYYGETAQPKDFILRCFYSGKNVTEGLMSRIYQVFRIGRSGKLIFKHRPWCWYVATVVAVDCTQLLNYANGFVTITLRAYYPYARTDMFSIPEFTDWEKDIKLNSGLFLDPTRIPYYKVQNGKKIVGLTLNSPLTQQTNMLLYNPGTERAKVAIEIAGDVGNGVVIANKTTGQKCKFVGISRDITTNVNRYVVADSLNNKVVLTGGNVSTQLAFLYHDNGYLELAPGCPIVRDVDIHTSNNGLNKIYLDKIIDEESIFSTIVGKYFWIGGNDPWRKITDYDDENLVITTENFMTANQHITTDIVNMNEIVITPVSTMSLTRLNFVYLPTFS